MVPETVYITYLIVRCLYVFIIHNNVRGVHPRIMEIADLKRQMKYVAPCFNIIQNGEK